MNFGSASMGNNIVQEGSSNSIIMSAMSSHLNLGTALSEIVRNTLKYRENCLRQLNLCLLTEISIVNIEFGKRKSIK